MLAYTEKTFVYSLLLFIKHHICKYLHRNKMEKFKGAKVYTEYLILVFCSCKSTDGLVVCHLPFGPTAYFTLYNVVMRHDVPDIGTISEAYPHLIFHNFTSRLGKRVSEGWISHSVFSVRACFCIQLISCAHTGVQYPQVSLSSSKRGQQACDHIRQPRGLHHFQVSI